MVFIQTVIANNLNSPRMKKVSQANDVFIYNAIININGKKWNEESNPCAIKMKLSLVKVNWKVIMEQVMATI